MAFYKTGYNPQEASRAAEKTDLDSWTKQAQATCQTCGYRMTADKTGTPVCRTPSCPRAISE